jgi:hypothetical protein
MKRQLLDVLAVVTISRFPTRWSTLNSSRSGSS